MWDLLFHVTAVAPNSGDFWLVNCRAELISSLLQCSFLNCLPYSVAGAYVLRPLVDTKSQVVQDSTDTVFPCAYILRIQFNLQIPYGKYLCQLSVAVIKCLKSTTSRSKAVFCFMVSEFQSQSLLETKRERSRGLEAEPGASYRLQERAGDLPPLDRPEHTASLCCLLPPAFRDDVPVNQALHEFRALGSTPS